MGKIRRRPLFSDAMSARSKRVPIMHDQWSEKNGNWFQRRREREREWERSRAAEGGAVSRNGARRKRKNGFFYLETINQKFASLLWLEYAETGWAWTWRLTSGFEGFEKLIPPPRQRQDKRENWIVSIVGTAHICTVSVIKLTPKLTYLLVVAQLTER